MNREIASWLSQLSEGRVLELPENGLEDISELFDTYVLNVCSKGTAPLAQISWVSRRSSVSSPGRLLVLVEKPIASISDSTLPEIHRELEVHWTGVRYFFSGNTFCFAAGNDLEEPSLSFPDWLENFYRNQARMSQRNATVLQTRLGFSQRNHRRISETLERTKEELLKVEGDALNLQAQVSGLEREVTSARKTLSFRLGYELIHGFKSANRLASLPRALWTLRNDAAQKKRSKRSRVRSDNANKAGFRIVEESRTQRYSGKARLKVSCIVDDFTFAAFAPECELLALTPDGWQAEIDTQAPDMLLVESAWRGQNGEWKAKVAPVSVELEGIISHCQKNGIPTVFWAKEDPVHFSHFVRTASCFDFVFTTDIDCIARYKQELGHNQVYLLPFACQPTIHNPTEVYERKPGACFAGAYYAEFPERQFDFFGIVKILNNYGGVDIFDRHFDSLENSRFPEYYHPLIQGKLEYSEIDKAYKGYRTAININTIKQSQTMFARRAFELLASNTLVVSNFSQGMSNLLGELAISSDFPDTVKRWMHRLEDESVLRTFKLMGLRTVLSEHTYQHRLSYIHSKVFSRTLPDDLPVVVVVAHANSEQEFEAICDKFGKQEYKNKRLLILAPGFDQSGDFIDKSTVVIDSDDLEKSVDPWLRGSDYVAYFHSSDDYGPYYLLDMVLATKYSDCPAIGKRAFYEWSEEAGVRLQNDGEQYSSCDSLEFRASMVYSEYFLEWKVNDLVSKGTTIEGIDCYSISEHSYCRTGANVGPGVAAEYCGTLDGVWPGRSMSYVIDKAEAVEAGENTGESTDGTVVLSRFEVLTIVNADTKIQDLDGTDIFRISDESLLFAEIAGNRVMSGNLAVLQGLVSGNDYQPIVIHDVEESIWDTVADCISTTKLSIVINDYVSDTRSSSHKFLGEILTLEHCNLEVTFSSQYLLDSMLELFSILRGNQNFRVVYPGLELEHFPYKEKTEDQRRRLLVDMSDVSDETYRLIVDTILCLSAFPCFPEMEIHLIHCPINESTLNRLSHFDNVLIESGDFSCSELASLYESNGLLLSADHTPGSVVAIRRALASGVVPVAYAHGLVTEFVDAQNGVLVTENSCQALAKAIDEITSDGKSFIAKSRSTHAPE